MSGPGGSSGRGRRPAFFWVVCGAAVALLGYYPFVLHLLLRHGSLETARGWRVGRTPEGRAVVREVDPRGPAAGRLQAGDRIAAIDGNDPLPNYLSGHFVDRQAGDAYTIRVDRDSRAPVLTLALRAPPSFGLSWTKVPTLLLSLAFYVVGVVLGTLRPANRAARTVSLAALLAAAFFLAIVVPLRGSLVPPREHALLAALYAPLPLLPAVVYRGYYRLPPGVPPGRPWNAAMYGLYAWAALGCACLNLHSGLRLAGADLLLAFARAWPAAWQAMTRVESWGVAQVAVGAIATLAVMLRNYRVVRDTEQRRRIRWFIYGATAGTAPAGAMAVLMFLAPLTGRAALLDTPAFRWAMASAIAAAMLAPVSFAYASLKHDILDVRIVVGRGLQYLLARNVLRAALVLPVLPLAADVVRNPDRTLTQILLERPLYLALAAAGALSLRYRERLGRWVDRRFFREAYAAEGLLLALADEIGRRDSLPDLARLAGGQIESALHPRSVHLFLLDDAGAMGLGYSSDAGVEAPRIRPDSELPRLVEARAGALTLPVAGASLPAEDRAWLDRLGARLVVPVGGGERRLVGLLLLGEKRSEEAYGAQDRRLLEAVAGQIAVAYENAALERKLGEEARVKQEVLARLDARGVNLLKECPRCGTCYDRSAECCDRDGSALAPTLPVERTIEGKYRLERLLGRGGMGAVYQATDLRLGRDVAVKIMTGARLGDPDGLRRFEREARASARLRHPGIVTVHDYGRLGGEGAYLVMERLAGRTLRAELQDRGAVPPATAAGWFDQICEAVTAAHRAGVVHRDLKPENVFLAREEGAETQRGETVKILDFGLAKWTLPEGESRSLTAAGTVLGTLTYMSPEQLAGTPVDERTDVFAIGVMAFEAVTGRNPFRHDDSTRVVAAILHEAVALPAGPPERRELDDVLQRSLAKDREARIASVAGLQQLLIPALRRCPPLHTRAAPASDDEPTLERGE